MLANRVKKKSMDASDAISLAVKQARAVAASAQSVTIIPWPLGQGALKVK